MKFPLELLQRCWFLAGPTAAGKSALAIHLARTLGGEIVSMDSMAIYRGMDIGTAKPSLDEQAEIPHHLIDIVDPHEEYSTAEYVTAAMTCVHQIVLRGHVPIFVGGTGLYLRSLLRGVFEGPPADWDFRQQLLQSAAEQPADWLHRRLQGIDPVTAARLHANDTRRLIRALEIHTMTGSIPSELLQETPLSPADRPAHVFWLHPPRSWLYDRINRRVDVMFQQGLEQEVQSLLAAPQPPGRTASQALGYREMIDWLQGRSPSRDSTRELIQAKTRQFAKRQHTWFRNLTECQEIVVSGTESTEELLSRLQTAASVQV